MDVDISQVNTNQEVTSETRDLKGNPIYNDISGNTIFTVGKDHYKFTSTDGKKLHCLRKPVQANGRDRKPVPEKQRLLKEIKGRH